MKCPKCGEETPSIKSRIKLCRFCEYRFVEEKKAIKFEGCSDAEELFYKALDYENGNGVPQDYAEAVKWYKLAAAHGIADALERLIALGEEGMV